MQNCHSFKGTTFAVFVACMVLLQWNQWNHVSTILLSSLREYDDSRKQSTMPDMTATTTTDRCTTEQQQRRSFSSSSPMARRSNATNFWLEPDHFVHEMTTCFHDSNCRIYYFHFGKTGGQDMEKRMFTAFPPHLVPRFPQFQANTTRYCHAKFSSYEVSGDIFLRTIIPTCMTMLSSSEDKEEEGAADGGGTNTNTNKNRRAIVLVTYREPIQRTLSYIHQMCNRHSDTRDNRTQHACLRCSFEQDKDYWMNLVDFGVKQYKELQDVANANIPNVSVLTIDTTDLFSMYERLSILDGNYSIAFQINNGNQKNKEITSRCNFGFPSEMMRGLKTAQDVYRNLSLALSSA